MKNFAVITNAFKDEGMQFSNEIADYIRERGGKVTVLASYAGSKEETFELSDISEDTEGILVLGGDGTLIRAATKVEERAIPLIGVNLGTLGYLCELEKTTVFQAIDRLMEDSYMMEERMMLTGHKEGESQRKCALNDIVIHRGGSLSILKLNVYVNGEL